MGGGGEGKGVTVKTTHLTATSNYVSGVRGEDRYIAVGCKMENSWLG